MSDFLSLKAPDLIDCLAPDWPPCQLLHMERVQELRRWWLGADKAERSSALDTLAPVIADKTTRSKHVLAALKLLWVLPMADPDDSSALTGAAWPKRLLKLLRRSEDPIVSWTALETLRSLTTWMSNDKDWVRGLCRAEVCGREKGVPEKKMVSTRQSTNAQ